MAQVDALPRDLVTKFGEPMPDLEADSQLFDKDRRRTSPVYKTYFRIKKEVRSAIEEAKNKAEERLAPLEGGPERTLRH